MAKCKKLTPLPFKGLTGDMKSASMQQIGGITVTRESQIHCRPTTHPWFWRFLLKIKLLPLWKASVKCTRRFLAQLAELSTQTGHKLSVCVELWMSVWMCVWILTRVAQIVTGVHWLLILHAQAYSPINKPWWLYQ